MVRVPIVVGLIALLSFAQTHAQAPERDIEDMVADALIRVEEKAATAIEEKSQQDLKEALKDYLAIKNSKYLVGKRSIKLVKTTPLKDCYMSPEKWEALIDIMIEVTDPIMRMEQVQQTRCIAISKETPPGFKDKGLLEMMIWVTERALKSVGLQQDENESWSDVARAFLSSIFDRPSPKWRDFKLDVRYCIFFAVSIFIALVGSKSVGTTLLYYLHPHLGALVAATSLLQYIPTLIENAVVVGLTATITASMAGTIPKYWCNLAIGSVCTYFLVSMVIKAREKVASSWAALSVCCIVALGYLYAVNGGDVPSIPLYSMKSKVIDTWTIKQDNNSWSYAMMIAGRVISMTAIATSLMVTIIGAWRYRKIALEVANASKKGVTDRVSKHMDRGENFLMQVAQRPVGVALLVVYATKMLLFTDSFVNHVAFDITGLVIAYGIYKNTIEGAIDQQASAAANAGNFVTTCQDKTLVTTIKDIDDNTESTRKFLQVVLSAIAEAAIIASWGAPFTGALVSFMTGVAMYMPGRHQRFAYNYAYAMYAISLIEWISPTLIGLAGIFAFVTSNQSIVTWSKRGFMKFGEIVPDEGGKLLQAHI